MIELVPFLSLLSYFDYKYQKVPVILLYIALIVELLLVILTPVKYPLVSGIYVIVLYYILRKKIMKWADVVLLAPLCLLNPYILPLSLFIHICLQKTKILKNNGFIPSITLSLVVLWMLCFK